MEHQNTQMNVTLPKQGRGYEAVLEELDQFGTDDPEYKKMKLWSLVYYIGDEHTDFLKEAYGKYLSANGLNPMAFKSLKHFETEVIKMTAGLLNGDRNVTGVMTSGGTESCLLAVKTYRDYGKAIKKIKNPNMVVPETAHVAWEKGAEYFGVKIRRASLAKDYRVNVKALKKLVDKNTVMILGSAPEYPHGMIDPIADLSEIALKKKIPLHVDACLGGFFLPFVEKLGHEIPAWDFRVPGVTSVSADVHKYGYSAKGASVLIYRNIDIMKHQFFVCENWPGGVFASPALLGTRPGGAYAAAWASMQAIGEDGYLKFTRDTMNGTREMMKGVADIPELKIIGTPLASVFSFRSNTRNVDIYAVGDMMENKGWHIDRLQRPEALHAMVTPLHQEVIDKYISDLKESVAYVKEHPELSETGGAAMYGMIANIPLRGAVKKQVLNMFAQLYGPEAKMIVPDYEHKTNQDETDISTKLAMTYLKIKRFFEV